MKTLEELRQEIDALDGELSTLLVRRFALTDAVAETKRATARPVLDSAREQEVLASVSARAGADLADEICSVFAAIIETSRNRQARRLSGARS